MLIGAKMSKKKRNRSKMVIFLQKYLVIRSKFTTFAAEINKIDV